MTRSLQFPDCMYCQIILKTTRTIKFWCLPIDLRNLMCKFRLSTALCSLHMFDVTNLNCLQSHKRGKKIKLLIHLSWFDKLSLFLSLFQVVVLFAVANQGSQMSTSATLSNIKSQPVNAMNALSFFSTVGKSSLI